MPWPLYAPSVPLTVPLPLPTLIGYEYVPVVVALPVATPPPESSPADAAVACEVVSSMVRTYCVEDVQVVVAVFVEPLAAVLVCVCEPASSAVRAAVSVKLYWPLSLLAMKV